MVEPGKYAVDFVLNEKWTASILRRPKNLAKRLQFRSVANLDKDLLNLTFNFLSERSRIPPFVHRIGQT